MVNEKLIVLFFPVISKINDSLLYNNPMLTITLRMRKKQTNIS